MCRALRNDLQRKLLDVSVNLTPLPFLFAKVWICRNPLYHDRNGIVSVKRDQILEEQHLGRKLLWEVDSEEQPSVEANSTKADPVLFPMCPMSVNQSENARIALELHRYKHFASAIIFFKLQKFRNKLYAFFSNALTHYE